MPSGMIVPFRTLLACALALMCVSPVFAQDLTGYCEAHAGHALGLKDGKTVPITCDSVQTMAEWFPVPAMGQGYVSVLQTLSKAKFSTFYDDPKNASLKMICAPNAEGYLCTFPLGPAELLVGANGIVRAISKTVSKDGPEFASVMAKSAKELGVDSLSDEAEDLALAIEADAMKAGAGSHVDVTKTSRSYVYRFHS